MRAARWWLGAAALAVSVVLLARVADVHVLREVVATARARPGGAVVALVAYAAAFVLRAALWRRLLPDLRLRDALAALHVATGANHVLPVRLGEVLRVTSVVRRAGVDVGAATASTLVLRAADVLAVVALAVMLAPAALAGALDSRAAPSWWAVACAVLAAVALAGAAGWRWLAVIRRAGRVRVRLPGPLVAAGAAAAWVLESGVVWQSARWAGLDIGALDAVLVTAVTIAAQTVALAPGGIGTYEAAATAALVALGGPGNRALAAAVAAHVLKTGYALVTGAVAAVVPAPPLWGRLRLPRRRSDDVGGVDAPPDADARQAAPDAPVVLFMPAHDEAASVGGLVRRVPAAVENRRVVCLVVDDGSTDGTAAVAEAAGARVIRLPTNGGLGAAVRCGLAEASALGAAAVAFCDADGEYAPEELATLVAPILGGRADYVVGSRFAGRIDAMRPHRRVGNLVLTQVLSVVARRRLTDGQSGYRALSASAAASAEIIHDFNYAQVLTLDLLAKGYRYAEVPISYRFRTTGRSFVRLGRYLRRVVPAVHRELNAT